MITLFRRWAIRLAYRYRVMRRRRAEAKALRVSLANLNKWTLPRAEEQARIEAESRVLRVSSQRTTSCL